MPLFALAILLGALLAFYGNQLQDPFWGSFVPLLLLLARFNRGYRFLILLVAGMLWSTSLLQFQLSHRLVDDFDNRTVLLQGVIADVPRVDADRISLLIEDVELHNYPARSPRRVRLNWYRSTEFPRAGERWQFRVRIRQPRGLLNPAGFDYERWLFVSGIDATGYVLRARENRRLGSASAFSLNGWRSRFADQLERDCGQCLYSGLIKALVLGLRDGIDPKSRQLLQSTGTAHLLAISGLHIGMVALLGFAIGRYAWRWGGYRSGINRSQLASLCALILAFLYAGLAGFSLPTLRALLMLAVVLLGLQVKRKVELLQSISLAMLLILVVDPLAVGMSSFWLSFGALLVIGFSSFRQPYKKSRWRQMVLLQVFFTVLFAPLGLLIFGQLNPASLPANLLAIPALSLVILPAVLLAALFSVLDLWGASLLLALVDQALGYLLLLLDWLLAAGLQSIEPDVIHPALIILSMLALWLLLLPRWSAVPALALTMLVVVVLWQPVRLKQGEFEITVLDVGMGSSILLRTRHHSLVYDFGPGRPGRPNAAERYLLPLLRKLGIGQPDLFIVSHVDQDHSGGFQAFRDDYLPTQLLSGTPDELRQRFELDWQVGNCHAQAGWSWDGVRFKFLPLQTWKVKKSNNRSCVLLVQGFHRVLLPGDIEASQEAQLVETQGRTLAADVLMAPHHGSKTSSSQGFTDLVDPELVVFMMSRNNRWGFPHFSVEERYRERGSRILRNDRDGAIVFVSRRDELSVKTLRKPPRRLWQRW